MRRILVADDDPRIVEAVQACLTRDGFRVMTAADGAEVLTSVEAARPALALVDAELCDIDGLELIRRLQRDYDLPVILMSDRGDEVSCVVGLDVGADDYITKPLRLREVVARVSAVLRRSSRTPADEPGELVVGRLVIDDATHVVTLGGSPIELTRTEFDILGTMARDPVRVFTRSQLTHVAQKGGAKPHQRSIDSHVVNLRRKLDDGLDPEFLKTVIGVGYKLQ